MENKRHNNEKRTYVKPEAELLPLLMNENIAASNTVDRFFDDEFNGEDDVFD